jgi:tRNA A-37 threonylcarbamoyl transferase component Bud32
MPNSGFEGLLTGHTLAGRYHVEEVIGRGGFAAVYRATDQRLGRTVAVKVITQSASNPEMRADLQRRFEREARAIAMLHHPNVVTVFDFGADPDLGLDFLVMELLRGEVLSDRLKRAEPLPIPEALRILRDAAAGVDAGHRAGLIHRDIKPGNIFLSRPEHGGPAHVSVLDFGIARFTEAQETTQLTHSGRGFLSPAYASPEQLRAERPITPASDVFSLGVIGYHLLAREKPFRHDRMHPGPYAKPPIPLRERNPAVPAAVAAVIEQAMRDEPSARFADAGAFVRALVEAEAATEGEGIAAAAPVAAPDAAQLQAPAPVAIVTPSSAAPVEASDARMDAAPPADVSVDQARVDERAEADFAPPPVYAAAAPVVAAAAAEPRPAVHPPVSVDDTRRESAAAPHRPPTARKTNPALFAIPALLAVAIALWLALGRGGRSERVAAGPSPSATPPPTSAPAASNPQTAGGATPSQPNAGQTGTGQTGSGAGQTGTGAAPAGTSPSGVPGAATPASRPSAGQATPGGGIAAAPAATLPVSSASGARPRASMAPVAARTGGAGAEGLNHEGEALFERGELDGAIERFRAAVRAAPGNAYYRNNLGWALFQSGKVDEAGRELNEAVRLDPRRDIAYANIGEVERARGNIQAAIAAYERFLQLNTDPRRERIAREKLRTLRGG